MSARNGQTVRRYFTTDRHYSTLHTAIGYLIWVLRAKCAVRHTSMHTFSSSSVPNAFFRSSLSARAPFDTLLKTVLDCSTSSRSFSLYENAVNNRIRQRTLQDALQNHTSCFASSQLCFCSRQSRSCIHSWLKVSRIHPPLSCCYSAAQVRPCCHTHVPLARLLMPHHGHIGQSHLIYGEKRHFKMLKGHD